MHMRLGFAIAANLDPDILLLDEIFAVGRRRFSATVHRDGETISSMSGRTILFVSHSPSAVRAICQRVCVLEQGDPDL